MASNSKKPNGRKHPEALPEGITGLLYQLLETELGGVQVYRTALQCAFNPDLIKEWSKYLGETERHVVVARGLLEQAGLDPDHEVPARVICRHLADGLVCAMNEAMAVGTPAEAQLTAAECVVTAETKDHQNWSLIGILGKQRKDALGAALLAAHEEIKDEEDHHLYHSAGWARELWVEAMGLEPVLPPPEELENVDSAIEAARAKKDARPD